MSPEIRTKLLERLNINLALEHAASIQYGTHAEIPSGLYAEPIMDRLKELQKDEEKHADELRTLIGDYAKGIPTMDVSERMAATDSRMILMVNIDSERLAIKEYQNTLDFLNANKPDLSPDVFATLEHKIRHLLMEEQEHVAELERLQ